MTLALPAVFEPHSPEARAMSSLFVDTLVICAVIGGIVAVAVAYCIVRFRHRGEAGEPKQVHGHVGLEVLWTAIPLGIVIWLFVLTVHATHDADPPVDRDPDLVITGHQWWWEVRYADGAITANEIHIPVGRPLLARIEAADVIHDFWVPELARKLDAIPGHPGYLWLQADGPGHYLGTCAEYCGAEHARMRILVIAEPEAAFDAWEVHETQAALAPTSAAAIRGAAIFTDKTCSSCHAIRGTQHVARVAPDLTHLAERETLAAGTLRNTPTGLARWLADPSAIKPASHMPDLRLSKPELADLVTYLETLR